MNRVRPDAFFNLESFAHRDLFAGCDFVWQALKMIPAYLDGRLQSAVKRLDCFGRPLPETLILWQGKIWREGYELVTGDVTKGKFRVRLGGEETSQAVVIFAGAVLWDEAIALGRGAVVEPGALIKGPTIIGAHTEIRQGAYVRGKCIVGDRCVVGHTTEMKSSVMLDDAKAGHFAYIGDSILGGNSNLGAGTKLANLKIKPGSVQIDIGGQAVDTGMRKLGAILGDDVQVGCNAVTNPGALIGRGSMVFPVTSVRSGYYEPNSIVRGSG
jgi:UDP-N-acetylglucosamine diphosphorylase / glucose-1-phosphate thymidylyltransferase / UDP-N-acetylgalactosamine diphosphorylase / glucosamine-1-phosphate N-acetyltransferase / galactosamine-1-phosphate N-acetyltransferase